MSSLLQVETQIGSHKIEMLAGRKPLGDSTSAQHEPKTPPPHPFFNASSLYETSEVHTRASHKEAAL